MGRAAKVPKWKFKDCERCFEPIFEMARKERLFITVAHGEELAVCAGCYDAHAGEKREEKVVKKRRTKEQKAKAKAARLENPIESSVQEDIVKELRKCLPDAVVASVPNETRGGDIRAVREQEIKKRMGLCRGFPDLTVWWRGIVVLIEVKRAKGGVVSDNQKAVHAQLERNGFIVHILRGTAGVGPLIERIIEQDMFNGRTNQT